MKNFLKMLALPACVTVLTAPCFAYASVMINHMIDSKFVLSNTNQDGEPIRAEAQAGP